MTPVAATSVYLLCLATSCACAGLLIRSYLRNRMRLILWTAASFVFLALNNLSLVADVVLFPNVYLLPLRQITALLAIGVLLYAFIWEVGNER
jgi:hypothetical protein